MFNRNMMISWLKRHKKYQILANLHINVYQTVFYLGESFLILFLLILILGRFYVGQNLYTYMSSAKAGGADWPAAIKAWFDEYKLYTYPNTPNSGTGHYTQV